MEGRYHGGRKPLQITREHNQIDRVIVEQCEKRRPVVRRIEYLCGYS